MSRINIPIKRTSETGYEVEAADNMPKWLRAADEKQKTAPEAARERVEASFLDNLNNILYQRPRYATVEDVVADYKEKTGLTKYLDNLANKKQTIKSAAQLKSIVESIEKKADGVATAVLPESLSKYESAGTIEAFLNNYIEDNPSATVPQVKHDLIERFQFKHGLKPEDINNKEVETYISDLIQECKDKNPAPVESNHNIGKSRGLEIDPKENEDYFAILNTAT